MPTQLLTDEELLAIDASAEIKTVKYDVCGKGWTDKPHEQKDCKGKLHPYTMMLGLRRAVAKAQLAVIEEQDAEASGH